jgi:hypothetical protein
MEHSFFSFGIKDTNIEINITPVEFFNVEFPIRYVVMYKLTMIDTKNPLKNNESIIPYYVSNGQTNKLRANMIYPFLCYSDWSNQGICPYYQDSQKKEYHKDKSTLLLKYTIGPNYSHTKLEHMIIEHFITKDGIEEENNRRKEYAQMETESQHFSIGLPSVMPRLSNFLDFILCILNENIIHFNPAVDNIRCFRPLENPVDVEYFNMKKCKYLPEKLTPEDDYRFVIITILSRFANLILKNHFLDNIVLVKLTAKPISKEDFNHYINACNEEYMIKNSISYANISLEFKIICQKKINDALSRTKHVDMTQEEMDMVSLSKSMLIFRIRNPFFIYKDHLTTYKMDCSKPGDIENEEMGGISRMD